MINTIEKYSSSTYRGYIYLSLPSYRGVYEIMNWSR